MHNNDYRQALPEMFMSSYQKLTTKKALSILAAVGLVVSSFGVAFVRTAEAADFSQAYVRYDRMSASTATNVLVVFTVPAGNATSEDEIEVTFPAGFTVSGSPTVNTTCSPGTALPGTLSAAGASQTVSVTGVTNLSASTQYCFNISVGITTHATPGQYIVDVASLASAAPVDTKSVATRVISNDQIVVTATVPPTFDFTLSANTSPLGTLSTSSVVSGTSRTVTIGTNAGSGWIVWVRSANVGLTSSAASYTVNTSGSIDATPSTLSTGSNGYVLDVDLTTDSATGGTGTVSVAAEYNGASSSAGGTLSTSYQPAASADGPTDGDIVTLIPRASISALAKAASDYTDTLTVVGAGNF